MIKIEDELKNDFLDYATEVNNNRSFADARDALKPVQRAILWDMWLNKYTNNKPHVKCAKISGSVIGHLHPHGDGAVYEALVRMSQDWVYHKEIAPIDFHGANGSIIAGNTPASSRYTECRLSKFSEENFFGCINKNVVDFIDNFSEDEKWPEVFPCIVPMLLLSQVSGIGYTIANDWLPHNLIEITEKIKEYLSTGNISINDLAPDFPTGGVIINKSDLHTIYETGKGSVIVRGKVSIEDNLIKITELPYQVYAEPFIQKIKDLVNAGQLSGIEDICNKSDDNGLLIEIECSENAQVILNKLYKLTDLQVTFSANQMALVDGVPQMLNLKDYIKVYIDHNINCIKREYQFDLDRAEERKEIVDGLIRAISIIDDIISTIKISKSSEDAKQELIKKFSFTENQAKAIVDMRLGKLANLEVVELNKELTELIKVIDKCNKLLISDKLQKKEFLSRLSEFTNKYGWQRRTEVTDIDIEAEKVILKQQADNTIKEFMICLTENNYIKKIPTSKYKVKDDDIISVTNSDDKSRFILISKSGMMYKLDTKKIPVCSQNASGSPLSTFINDNIVTLYNGSESPDYMIMITRNGLIKKIEAKTIFELSKCVGAQIMKIDEDDEIIWCSLMNDNESVTLKSGKKEKKIEISSLIAKGRGAGGIVGIKVKDKLEIK